MFPSYPSRQGWVALPPYFFPLIRTLVLAIGRSGKNSHSDTEITVMKITLSALTDIHFGRLDLLLPLSDSFYQAVRSKLFPRNTSFFLGLTPLNGVIYFTYRSDLLEHILGSMVYQGMAPLHVLN
jgi:hypothetical protein